MLTGSGIVADCFGLGWLVAEISSTAKVVLVTLSLGACTSDSICMAIDHVWSNYVLSKSSIKECTEHKTNVLTFINFKVKPRKIAWYVITERNFLKSMQWVLLIFWKVTPTYLPVPSLEIGLQMECFPNIPFTIVTLTAHSNFYLPLREPLALFRHQC